ncbi:MAG: ATP F0F1 synthase subunit gamma [Acidithiobacillales bacterium SG8_45]|jgi:F-type H+-transporting ATPase subunit gamma|nr:MAG: ATP F0F1 synthase subunit gamma [Acidithiobacillales bacterium SG8_45]
MASGKEIRTQIKSIKNTQKITSAMQMVAASKMRKAQERMQHARPYAEKIRNVIGHLRLSHPEYKHPFMVEREAKRVGLIVVTTDRGLCGGLNTNALKLAVGEMKKWNDRGAEVDVCTIGNKGLQFLRRLGANIVAEKTQLGDAIFIEELIGSVKVMLDAYEEGRLDRLFLVYSEFVNTMTQKPTMEQLLPLAGEDDETLKHHWDYIYEPDAKEVMGDLLTRYIESQVYHGVSENMASEQSSRMVAMKSATENAGNLIDDLTLRYNKARQAAITQEISEIVGGAAAV